MIKVSVLVPVYGVESYLNEFFDSLSRQSFAECEFIIVNDASQDNSHEIIEKFVSKEPRAIYINKKVNEGEMKARQNAFEIAKGEYVINIDSDDYISDDFISNLYNHAQVENLDICMSNVMLFNDYDKVKKPHGKWFEKDFTFDKRNISETLGLPYATWCRLVKRELLIKYEYSYLLGETDLTRLQYLPSVRSGVASRAIHYYRQRSDSLSALGNSKNKYSQSYTVEKIEKVFESDKKVFGSDGFPDVFSCFRYVHTLKLILLSFINNGSIYEFYKAERILARKYNVSFFPSFINVVKLGKRDRLFALIALARLSPIVLLFYRQRFGK